MASLIGFGLTFGRIEAILSKLWWLEGLAITAFVLQAITSFLLLRLNYRMRWYMVSDSSVRIRQGIFNIREQTMTVANIQNMEVRQGPLQRLFGISDLEVRTAGGSGNKQEDPSKSWQQDPHVGALRGLDNANEVRDLIAEALRRYRDAGLGDPDEPASLGDDSSLRAARNMLDEVRGLRRALALR